MVEVITLYRPSKNSRHKQTVFSFMAYVTNLPANPTTSTSNFSVDVHYHLIVK